MITPNESVDLKSQNFLRKVPQKDPDFPNNFSLIIHHDLSIQILPFLPIRIEEKTK